MIHLSSHNYECTLGAAQQVTCSWYESHRQAKTVCEKTAAGGKVRCMSENGSGLRH